MINEFFKTRKQLAGAVVLVDIRHEPDPKDTLMIKMLQDLKINFMVAATKCDKIPSSKIPAHLKMLKTGFNLKDIFICEFSALKKIGTQKILDWIENNISVTEREGRVIIHEGKNNA
jgi:GTP-binding protein